MDEALNKDTQYIRNEYSSSYNSLEIDHQIDEDQNKHILRNSKISGDFILEHMSVSLNDASNNLYACNKSEEESSPIFESDSYIQGAILMFITTLFWSTYHIVVKYVYSINPSINGNDAVLFIGISCSITYFIYGKYIKAEINFFKFEFKVQIIVIIRVVIGCAGNIFLLIAAQYISIGKLVLIFSLNPLFCAIAAGIFLKEHITALSVLLILCSVFGVYLLTLNKPQNPHDESMELIGYILILGTACFYGCLFVVNRYLILYKVPIVISPLYFGIGSLLQSLLLMVFSSDNVHFEKYDLGTVIGLSVCSISVVFGQMTWIYSTKYSAASKMAPIGYIENVFTLLSDVILFNYNFILSDVFGMVVIVICIIIPVVKKFRPVNKKI